MPFHMFLFTPPETIPVNTLYREKRAFGPYSEGSVEGFSDGIVLGVAETAPQQYRSLRTFCNGMLKLLGVQDEFSSADPSSPLVISLKPLRDDVSDLAKMTGSVSGPYLSGGYRMDMPTEVLYVGLDPNDLKTNLLPIINAAPNPSGLDLNARWDEFLGGKEMPIAGGIALGNVSQKNLEGGFRNFTFKVRTGKKTYLDPVVMYSKLTGTLSSPTEIHGSYAIPEDEWLNHPHNTWLEVVTKDRVLITFRDEWDDPLVSPSETAILSDGSNQINGALSANREGTLVAPDGWSSYICTIEGRKLTRIPSDEGALDSIAINTSAPAHFSISTVRPEDWFSSPYPAFPSQHADKELRHQKDGRILYYTEGNSVEPLIDGLIAFPRIVEDIRLINSANHFILIAGWDLKHDFNMVNNDHGSSLAVLLTNANNKGARIRAMIWDNVSPPVNFLPVPIPDCISSSKFIEELVNGESVLDNRTHHVFDRSKINAALIAVAVNLALIARPGGLGGVLGALALTAGSLAVEFHHAGAHHSKFIVIRNSNGIVAYLGGMDIVPDRLDGPAHITEHPYHDVHCRIIGPAVEDIVKVFEDRWNDHPINEGRVLSVIPTGISSTAGTCMVQIARTFGARTQNYAPEGEQSIWATLRQGIRRAKKYIYIEDQYLWYGKLSEELDQALSTNNKLQLVIVIDPTTYSSIDIITEYSRGDRARYLFLNPLHNKYNDRVHVFTTHKGSKEIKVHTKVVIIDDIFATIGSANMGQRSMTHDTETNIFVLDGIVKDGARKFARDFRIKLWAEHLGWHSYNEKYVNSYLGNVDDAVKQLKSNANLTSRLKSYNFDLSQGSTYKDYWFEYADPDGSKPP